jgi:hypothetical protein
MTSSLVEIDARIREEKRLTALESQNEAWAEGTAWGIEPEILAEAALATAFGELARCCGEDAALAMLERMRERVIAGEFQEERVRH